MLPSEPDGRIRIEVRGAVQGVGFRPFVHRLANRLGLSGWVRNTPEGVRIEIEGPADSLREFLLRLEPEAPPTAFIYSMEHAYCDYVGYSGFEILQSEESGPATAWILPDIATCRACLEEIFDPADRRYLYPFTNCTHCGPRFSIVIALPYDRSGTSMKSFAMCGECAEEYADPGNRRFHAQPNACPQCGPHLELWDARGRKLASHGAALEETTRRLDAGQILAVKGVGGFHLMLDARNADAIDRLRRHKPRAAKPVAVMFPDVESIRGHCELSALEERLLRSPAAPIVLLRKRPGARGLPESLAPGISDLGTILPHTPLHHLLLRALGFPVVATSGNLADETVCIDNSEALSRLGGWVDGFLTHNRDIVNHVDDSVTRVILGRDQVLRRARGYAPLPLLIPEPLAPPNPDPATCILAVGAHLKNTIALTRGREVIASQHIGDLDTIPTRQAFQRAIANFTTWYTDQPARLACDLHPDYASSQYAAASGRPVTRVQHHHAHVFAALLDNELPPPALGIAWDGLGYGPGGELWGGEFLHARNSEIQRVASFQLFPLPGGAAAMREPRRCALGLLHKTLGNEMFSYAHLPPLQSFTSKELKVLPDMLRKGAQSPPTTSAGRLFDGVASLLGIRHILQYEGQAAMELEARIPAFHGNRVRPEHSKGDSFISDEEILGTDYAPGPGSETFLPSWTEGCYTYTLTEASPSNDLRWWVDWKPMVRNILEDQAAGTPTEEMAVKFHNTLVEIIVTVARLVGEMRVALTGGCFQNRYLTERAVWRLRQEGFTPYWNQRIPPNDGGIAMGQALAALRSGTV